MSDTPVGPNLSRRTLPFLNLEYFCLKTVDPLRTFTTHTTPVPPRHPTKSSVTSGSGLSVWRDDEPICVEFLRLKQHVTVPLTKGSQLRYYINHTSIFFGKE